MLVLVVLAGGGLAWVLTDLGTAVHLLPLSVVTNVPAVGKFGLVDMMLISGCPVYGRLRGAIPVAKSARKQSSHCTTGENPLSQRGAKEVKRQATWAIKLGSDSSR